MYRDPFLFIFYIHQYVTHLKPAHAGDTASDTGEGENLFEMTKTFPLHALVRVYVGSILGSYTVPNRRVFILPAAAKTLWYRSLSEELFGRHRVLS